MSIPQEIKDSFRYGSILTKLIYVNIAVFLLFRFIQLFMVLATGDGGAIQSWLYFFSVPSDPTQLIKQPWSAFTYMFLHFDFLHLLFNTLYLYWFGRLFLQLIDSRWMLRLYLMEGLAGAVLYILAFNLIPGFFIFSKTSILLGASASVMAILFSVSAYRPNFTVQLLFIGEVKLKYVALVAFLIDIISIPTLNNTGGHLAHIGGALIGLYYGWSWASKGLPNIPEKEKKKTGFSWFQKKSNLKVTHKRSLTDLEYNTIKVQRQKEMDRILEKIKHSGYDSLSASEKKTLFDASKDQKIE